MNPAPIRIRPAALPDAEAIRDLVERELFLAEVAEFHWHTTESVTRTVEAQRYAVAEIDGALAGILAVDFDYGDLWIEVIAVEPAFRRRGVARALVEVAVRIARARSLPRVRVSTFRQYAVEPVYQRLGFRIVDQDDVCTWLDLPVFSEHAN